MSAYIYALMTVSVTVTVIIACHTGVHRHVTASPPPGIAYFLYIDRATPPFECFVITSKLIIMMVYIII